jgi:hypothetical protein
MSCACAKASRESPSSSSPAIASRGANAMAWTRPSRPSQWLRSFSKSDFDFRVARDFALQRELGTELLRHLGDAVLEALVLVGERDLGALAPRRPGDAVGDRAVGEHAGHQDLLPESSAMRPIILCAGASSRSLLRLSVLGANAAGADKILRITFQAAETGSIRPGCPITTPLRESRRFSIRCSPTTISRAAKLVPNTTEALPQVSADGRTYTLRLRKGIRIRRRRGVQERESRAYRAGLRLLDQAFFDPKYRSPYAFIFTGKIVGLDELAAQAKKTGALDYEAPVAGCRRRTATRRHPPARAGFQLSARRASVGRRGSARGDRGLRRGNAVAPVRHGRLPP